MRKLTKIPSRKVRSKRDKLLLTQKKTVLLLHSRVIADYPGWAEILAAEPLTVSRTLTFNPEQQQFVHNVLPEVQAQAEQEWRLETEGYYYEDRGPDVKKWTPCSLCDTPNRYIYYIVNTANGNRLNVGSECMKDFSIETGGKSLQLLAKEAVRLHRIAELDRKFPRVQQIMRNWFSEAEHYPVVIPTSMSRPFQRLGAQAREVYEKFIDPDRKWTVEQDGHEIVSAIERALVERDDMLAQMSAYVASMEGSRYAVPTRLISWLVKRGQPEDATTIEWLREDGVIRGRTAHRIPEPEFMTSLAADLNKVLAKIGVAVARPVPERLAYLVRLIRGPRVHLSISHGDLLAQCGPSLFDGAPFDLNLEDIVDKSSIVDKLSRETAIGELSALLTKHGLGAVVGEQILEDSSALFDEWVLLERASNRYIVVANLDRLVDRFKGLVFNVGSATIEQLYQAITHVSARRFTRADLEREYGRRMEERRSFGGR